MPIGLYLVFNIKDIWNFAYKIAPNAMEGQQKETQNPVWHKDTTRKGLWSGEDDEFPLGVRDFWENIEMTEADEISKLQAFLTVIYDFDAKKTN